MLLRENILRFSVQIQVCSMGDVILEVEFMSSLQGSDVKAIYVPQKWLKGSDI
jgi:hypothetical protein